MQRYLNHSNWNSFFFPSLHQHFFHLFFLWFLFWMGIESGAPFAIVNVENCYDNLIGSIQFNAALFFLLTSLNSFSAVDRQDEELVFDDDGVVINRNSWVSACFFARSPNSFHFHSFVCATRCLYFMWCVRSKAPWEQSEVFFIRSRCWA